MSSSRIDEAGRARLAHTGRAGASRDGHRRWFKRLLPRTLFGRSLIIIILPLVLAQLLATWIFYDRHWDTVQRRLGRGARRRHHRPRAAAVPDRRRIRSARHPYLDRAARGGHAGHGAAQAAVHADDLHLRAVDGGLVAGAAGGRLALHAQPD